MEKQMDKTPEEMPQEKQSTQASPLSGVGLLSHFTPRLQKMIVDEILNQKCERATDIWYSDEATSCVWVMRNNMHWQLNVTASVLWQQLGDTSVKDLLNRMLDEFEGTDIEEARIQVVEFLLQAKNNGLITIPD